MKLYSKPGACSTADHIALQWAGGKFEVEIVDKDTMKAPAFLAINPAGAVPAVVDGEFVLTQNSAIMGYIADDSLMVGTAVYALAHDKLSEQAGRRLKLISGVVMAVLGLVMLLRPDWLT